MEKRIIFTNPEGGCSILCPSPQGDISKIIPDVGAMTEDQYFEWCKRDIPAGSSNVTVVPITDIPANRSNRKNWKVANGKIS